MPSPTTIEEFLDLVRKSGVADDKRLDAHVDKLRESGALPPEPNKLAGVLVRDGLLTHFQAEQFLLGKWRRFTIGKYKVLERLGAGGMGSVYLCEHKLMRRRVAVKVLPTAKAEDASSLERFYREARAVAALDHPNIVRAYDIDQDDKLHFLVMEHVDGANLQEIVKKSGPMNPIRAAHYMRQAALGLQHAHEAAGLVHRDIKPGNILVDRNGIVKILDMGLARFFHDEEDILTKKYDENVLGTADYLAPEQALDSHSVDIRADIYSLGATFYFCLTGRTPFAEGTVAQKLIWHQTRQPKPLRSLRADVPEGLAAVVERMMAKDPAHRYATPAEVADALAPWTQTPIPPPPESEMPQFSLAARGAGGPEAAFSSGPRTPSSGPPSSARKMWQVQPASSPGGNSPRPQAGTPAPPPANSPPAPRKNPPPADPRKSNPPPPSARAAVPPVAPADNRASVSLPPTQVAIRPAVNGRGGRPAPAAPAAPAVLPAEDEETPSWEKLTTDTDAPIPRAVTTRETGRKPAPTLPERWKNTALYTSLQRHRVWWVVGGATVLILLALGILLLVLFLSRPTPPPVPATREPLMVDPKGSDPTRRSLRAVLKKAVAGDRIVLANDIEEADVAILKPDLIIEGPPNKLIRWKLPARAPAGAKLLLLNRDSEGLQLRGVRLDGDNRAEALIGVFGHFDKGLKLSDLILQNFPRYGIVLSNCHGTPGNPVSFSRLTFVMTQPTQTGFFFADPGPKGSTEITVNGCDFGGGVPVKLTKQGALDPSVKFNPPVNPQNEP